MGTIRVRAMPDVMVLANRLGAVGDNLGDNLMSELDRTGSNVVQDVKSVVHVDTGALRASGHHDVGMDGGDPTLIIEFGGDDVDYAGYEETLHPYLAPTVEGASALMLGAITDAWDRL